MARCRRDYDPTVGRFTAPDPLGDTGGDHDLYDYCVDDPVSMHDPAGLMGKRPDGTYESTIWTRNVIPAWMLPDTHPDWPARQRAFDNAIRREAEGLVYGFADVVTFPFPVPSSLGFPAAAAAIGVDALEELRKNVSRHKKEHSIGKK